MADLSIKYKNAEIASLSASGTKTLTTKGMYCEDDITVTYTKPVAETFTTEEKTVSPTESVQEVTPTGADALSKVTVGAIASDYVGSGVTRKAGTTIDPTEAVQTAVASGTYTTGDVKIGAISSTYVGSGITRNPTLTANGATVTVPVGYYSTQATKSVASGTAGTPSASKSTVSNNQVTITPTVTNTTGYITGGTKNGTAVTVKASDLVSGSQTLSENKSYDVTNLASVTVNVPSSGTDTSDANATAYNIEQGYSAYVQGSKVNGLLESKDYLSFSTGLSYSKNGSTVVISGQNQEKAILNDTSTVDMVIPVSGTSASAARVESGYSFITENGPQVGTLVINRYAVVSGTPSVANYQNGDIILVRG